MCGSPLVPYRNIHLLAMRSFLCSVHLFIHAPPWEQEQDHQNLSTYCLTEAGKLEVFVK